MYIVYHCCSSVITANLFFFSNKFAYGGGVGVEGDWNY